MIIYRWMKLPGLHLRKSPNLGVMALFQDSGVPEVRSFLPFLKRGFFGSKFLGFRIHSSTDLYPPFWTLHDYWLFQRFDVARCMK